MATSSDRITSRLRGLGVGIDLVHLTNDVGEVHARQVGGGEELVVPSGGDAADAARTAWNRLAGRHGRYRAVVCFGGPQAMAPAPVWAAWLGAPLVTLLRGNDFETGVFSPRRSVLVDALRSSRVVATVSRDMAQRVGLLLGGAGPTVVTVTNGIDTHLWTVTDSDRRRAAAWRAATVPHGRRVVGLVGQLKAKKGAVDLLEAVRRSGSADRVHVALIGDLDPGLGEWLAADGGWLSWSHEPFLDRFELLARLPAIDVIALPSRHDGLPNVALEAATVGVPLLAAQTGGLADLAAAGPIGFTFDAGDADGLAEALVAALSCPAADLRDLGVKAARTAAGFDAQREAEAYLALFAEL